MEKKISKKTTLGLILIIVIIILSIGIILSNIYISNINFSNNGITLINSIQVQNHTVNQYSISVILPAASYITHCPPEGSTDACVSNQTSGIYNVSLELPYNGFLVLNASNTSNQFSESNVYINIINNINSNDIQSFYNGTSFGPGYPLISNYSKGHYFQELPDQYDGAYTNLTKGKTSIPVFSGNLILNLVNTNIQQQIPIQINLEYFGYKNQKVHKKTYYTVVVPPNGINNVYNITIQTHHSGFLALNISSGIADEPNYIYNSTDQLDTVSNYTNTSYLPPFNIKNHNDTGIVPYLPICYTNNSYNEAACLYGGFIRETNQSSSNTTSYHLYMFPVVTGNVSISIYPYSDYGSAYVPNNNQRYNVSWQYIENMP